MNRVNKLNKLNKIAAALMAMAAAGVQAQDDVLIMEEVLVTGGRDAVRSVAGSASFLDEENIATFDITDLNELLGQVPGVYIRSEDGYGLRPNIGIRGATSERSQKITLMEDGILIAPAPYSAPAAYYVPNVNRMAAVEVFKGPAAIGYGPHTVGGALNMVTPQIGVDPEGQLDVALGTDGYRKARGVYSIKMGDFAFKVDGLHYGADGFKKLDFGGDTGFERNDINLRMQWRSAAGASYPQQLDVKLGYADEDADETYLGLNDADFNKTPLRRYLGSAEDRFQSEHKQLHLLHRIELSDDMSLFTRAYSQTFERSWKKFDGFLSGLDGARVLRYPSIFTREMALLRGEENSEAGNDNTLLDITDNDRDYASSGVESRLSVNWQGFGLEHDIELGARFHHDQVERDHKIYGYLVNNQALVADGAGERGKKALNKASSDAWSVFVSDDMSVGDLTVRVGVRYESIEGEYDNYLTKSRTSNSASIVLPGLGLLYEWGNFSFLAGVNKGFSPAGPAAADSVEPEESINYEYGVRYSDGTLQFDVIGFFSDYSNLLGRCRVSDVGCEPGQEFNGGEVEIAGAELTGAYIYTWGDWMFPVNVSYTYTESAFQRSFQSGFSQWGLVRAGDELPYLPEHQGRLQFGAAYGKWRVDGAVKYVGQMRERPGQGGYESGYSTPALTTVSLSASYRLLPDLTLRLVGENLADTLEVVSRRPFGARSNPPRMIKIGLNYRF